MDIGKELCLKVCNLSKEVGKQILSEQKKFTSDAVEVKSLNSLVSYVDKQAEEQLITNLSKLLPGASFLAEEGAPEQQDRSLCWIIDPLDGTTNFIHGIPTYSISIALMKDGEVRLGVVYEINRDECFFAWKGGGAFLNEQQINVAERKLLADSLIATGFPYYDYDRMNGYLKTLQYFMKNTRGVRRIGSAAVDLAYVACGRFDVFFEYSLSPWDVAAGSLIVEEAGGIVTDFSNQEDYIFGKEIVASSLMVSEEFRKVITDNLS